jgi:hypothetical protein
MAREEIGGFAKGLADSISGYLGLQTQMGMQAQQNQAQFERQQALQLQGAELDVAKGSALRLYEQTLAGKVDPNTAASIHPTAAKLVEDFNTQNKRYPTVDEAKTLFGNLGTKQDRAVQMEMNREQRLNQNILQYTEALEKNPVHRKMQEQGLALSQLDDVAAVAKAGNTVASSAMGVKMARAMGEVGVLTESDITRYVQSGQLARGAADKLTRWIKGRPTEATIEEIQQIGSVLRDSFNTKVQPIYDRYINRLSTNMGISTEEASRRLDVPFGGRIKGQSPTDKITGPVIGTIQDGYRFKGGNPADQAAWEKL